MEGNPNDPFLPAENTDTTGATHQTHVDDSVIQVNKFGIWTLADGFSPTWFGDAHHMFPVPYGTMPNPFSSNPADDPDLPGVFDELGWLVSSGDSTESQVTDSAGQTLFNAIGSANTDPKTDIPGGTLAAGRSLSA